MASEENEEFTAIILNQHHETPFNSFYHAKQHLDADSPTYPRSWPEYGNSSRSSCQCHYSVLAPEWIGSELGKIPKEQSDFNQCIIGKT